MSIRVKFPTPKGTIEIGEGLPTYLISEIGLNHNGSEQLAKEMIYQSALILKRDNFPWVILF